MSARSTLGFGPHSRHLNRFLRRTLLAVSLIAIAGAPAFGQQNDPAPLDVDAVDSIADAGVQGVTTKLTTTPTSPIAPSGRYFLYGGQTVALVGITGEAIPHLLVAGNYPNGTVPVSSFCVFNFLPGSTTVRKYQQCLSNMQADGVNLLRLWVNFNAKPTPVSGTDHQPFKYYSGVCPTNPLKTAAWNLTESNSAFFSQIAQVVSDAQNRGIIVELTLFIPGSNADSQGGPWWSTNNCQQKGFRNGGVEDSSLFYQADNSTTDPFTAANLDTDVTNNQYMRGRQVQVMQWLVDAVYNYDNVYFELANEADLSGTSFPSFTNLVNWHHYMARRIYEYESSKGSRHHPISANLSVRAAIDSILPHLAPAAPGNAESKINIINSHYVKLLGNKPGVAEVDRHSAVKLVYNYNLYNSNGTQGTNNKAIWGFNETHITGLSGGSLSATSDSARAEAWQFMIDGGGVYDHLSYCWGNAAPLGASQGTCPTANAEDPNSLAARRQLGYLSRFLGTVGLSLAHRSTMNQTSFWNNLPADIIETGCNASNYCWAALEGTSRVAYIHHSSLTTSGNVLRYNPIQKASCPTSCLTSCTGSCPANCYSDTLTVKNLGNFGSCIAAFKAEWYTPDGTFKDGAGNLTPVSTYNFNVTGSGAQATLPLSPCYAYDLALKVTQIGIFCP